VVSSVRVVSSACSRTREEFLGVFDKSSVKAAFEGLEKDVEQGWTDGQAVSSLASLSVRGLRCREEVSEGEWARLTVSRK
jgi:hypothetical protein